MNFLHLSFLCLTFFGASSARAEVADKCPAFVSYSAQEEGAWSFLSAHDAVMRLLTFSAVYIAIAIALFFIIRKSKKNWPKFIPLAVSVILGLFLAFDSLPSQLKNAPCSHYFLLKEMPPELYRVQITFDFLLILVPLVLFVVLYKKSKK